MFRVYVSLILSMLLVVGSFANNVRIQDNARFIGFLQGDSLQVRFPLAWDNSWRDVVNWDAVYLFLKYRNPDKDKGVWHHAYLEPSGHNVGAGLEYTIMKSEELITGLMVFRNGQTNQGFGDISNNVRLLWNLKKGSAPYLPAHDEFEQGKIEFAVFAIEMVYVSNGPYYLGDIISYNSILNETSTEKKLIVGETNTQISFEGKNADVLTIPDNFPKGYGGFYCMKYEVSQEQYVSFLNFLPYDEQKSRIGNDLDKLLPGHFVFGSPEIANNRNSIVLVEKNGNAKPAVFGNDLNISNPYNRMDDGKAIACNYLTHEDMLAYCRWAGLRPMTELEYEKACRGLSVMYDPMNDYSWGNRQIAPLAGINNDGMLNEEALGSANVNAGGFFGPVRSGVFARRNNTNQELSGATYWGIMEMTGNVAEMYYNVRDGRDFVPEHGVGDIKGANNGWASTPSALILRGGSFKTIDVKELTTSYRREDHNILNIVKRDSTIGFRVAHSVEPVAYKGEVIFLQNGASYDEQIACQETPYAISGNKVTGGIYLWERSDSTEMGKTEWKVVEGEYGFSLITTDMTNDSYVDKYVLFRRRTVKPEGDSYSNQVIVMVPGLPVLSNEFIFIYGCGGDVDPLIAEASTKGTFRWVMVYESGDEEIRVKHNVDRDTLIIDPTGLKLPPGATSRFYDLRCEFYVGGTCFVASTAKVSLDGVVTCPVTLTDERDGNEYTVELMPDCRCWFAEPLRYKTPASASADNNSVNDVKYGRLYSWNDLQKDDLCPKGWKVPDGLNMIDVSSNANNRGAAKYTKKWVSDFTDHGWYLDKSVFGRGFYSAGYEQNSYIQIFPDKFLYIDGWSDMSQFSTGVYLPVRCVMNDIF